MMCPKKEVGCSRFGKETYKPLYHPYQSWKKKVTLGGANNVNYDENGHIICTCALGITGHA